MQKPKETLLATKQIIEALYDQGFNILEHQTIKINPFEPIAGMPKKATTALVIYFD